MQYFTIQGKTNHEAIEKMKNQYGDHSKILTYRNIRIGGFLGFFGREGVEITGYVSNEDKAASLEDSKIKVLEAAKKEQTLNYILREIKDLKNGINGSADNGKPLNPSLEKMRALLIRNDFSQEYTDEMIKRARSQFSLSELDNYTLLERTCVDWIAEKTPIGNIPQNDDKRRVFIIVGPTGVGKTTTIAKLAALYGIANDKKPPLRVRIITIDSYRIGAKKQIEIYGDIMRIPVSCAETEEDLKKLLALHVDADLVLIDTIGKSQRDYKKLAEMKQVLDGAGHDQQVHLAISATTKTRDLEDIFQQFEPFGYSHVIVTKIDETSQIGNIMSVVAKKNKPISYITDGQKVPQDIQLATVVRLLTYLEGFCINRDYMENKYKCS